jgi:hypothetical protein
MFTVLLHIPNSEPVKVDVDELPKPTDQIIVGKNPRERNDKEVNWTDEGVTTVIWPLSRIVFIQVLPSQDEQLEIEMPFR